jgi:hypothetical protein
MGFANEHFYGDTYPEKDEHGLTEWERESLNFDTANYHTAEAYRLLHRDDVLAMTEEEVEAAIAFHKDASREGGVEIGFLPKEQ